jgi:release factor glutamine methyltransferase
MPEPSGSAASALWALIGDATLAFEEAGVPSPRHDAEELAAWALGTDRSRLRLVEGMNSDAVARFRAGVERRRTREPLQHILGTAAFRYVEVAVGPGVFVPRPETELVAGAAIDAARSVRDRRPLVVDLCTGSGAIALAVADEVPEAEVHAVELSEDALPWARRNVQGSQVRLHAGDARTALPELDGLVDVVVSNPPYIPAGAKIRDREVLEHDPAIALWGLGPDGLEVLRGVARRASALLRPGGVFVVEHADVQGAAVVALLTVQGGWEQVADHRDLTGRDRYTTAVRPGGTAAARHGA